jgi:hypothetical protein
MLFYSGKDLLPEQQLPYCLQWIDNSRGVNIPSWMEKVGPKNMTVAAIRIAGNCRPNQP